MKFSCEKRIFEEITLKAANAAMNKSNISALECVAIHVKGGKITVAGNDLEIAIKSSFDCDMIETEGEIIIKANLLTETLKQMPHGTLTICVNPDLTVDLSCKQTFYNVVGMNIDQFPEIEEMQVDKKLDVPSNVLKTMFKGVGFAVATNDQKPILKGVFVEKKGDMLLMTALDGFRVAHRREKIASTCDDMSFVLSSRTLNELSKLLKDNDEMVEIAVGQHHCITRCGDVTLYSRLLEGEYVNYNTFFPKDTQLKVRCNTRELLNCVNRSAPLLQIDEFRAPILLEIAQNQLRAYCKSSMGKNNDVLEVETDGQLRIGFRFPILLESLKNKEDSEIILGFNGPRNPCVVSPVEGEHFLDLIVPVRIDED